MYGHPIRQRPVAIKTVARPSQWQISLNTASTGEPSGIRSQ